MPTEALLVDVAFDHAAADAFVAAANHTLGVLDRATAQRWTDGRRALAHCLGPFADDLADDLSRRCQEAARLADDLAAWRDRVLAAKAEAAARQRQVTAARNAAEHVAQIDRGDFVRAGLG
jgi:hypothetical protein